MQKRLRLAVSLAFSIKCLAKGSGKGLRLKPVEVRRLITALSCGQNDLLSDVKFNCGHYSANVVTSSLTLMAQAVTVSSFLRAAP